MLTPSSVDVLAHVAIRARNQVGSPLSLLPGLSRYTCTVVGLLNHEVVLRRGDHASVGVITSRLILSYHTLSPPPPPQGVFLATCSDQAAFEAMRDHPSFDMVAVFSTVLGEVN